MSLFSDGIPSSVDDLLRHDSALLTVSGTESIDVANKLALAYELMQMDIQAIFDRNASIYTPVLGQAPLDTVHLAMTPPLTLWHQFRSLELFYRDAYYSQLNDRYKGKWVEFQGLGRWAMGKFIETGAGLVIDPLPMPTAPVLTTIAASQAGATVYVTVTFVNSEAEESTPAITTSFTVTDGNVLVIGAPTAPSNATGWNAYAGLAPGGMQLQNPAPLAIGTTLQFIPPGVTGLQLPGTGQAANVTRDLPRRLMRG